ncbi:LysE/ArgO family amino acid transporter [Aneurinibacillus terranovensis]|uniref:LysE/ArgO family amino acid transporter n=1 Tax=Aneurinibacillus terranovensis TaxID=278991 RepID=UPI0003FBAA23|nr:LysE/ArgO family amino acid transporter [Aneurinibacillus terranovensis]
MIRAFAHGIILAFGLILPLGVQNIFVFNQGATQRTLRRALPAILMAGFCDMLLITLAVLGVSLLMFSFAWLKISVFIIGFFFLLYMGWATWNSKPGEKKEEPVSLSGKKQVIFAASVSLLNPHAIVDTIGVIGTNSLAYAGKEKWTFTLACILVSFIWFFALAIMGKMMRSLDHSGRWMKTMNRLSALLIWGVAVYMAVQLLYNSF